MQGGRRGTLIGLVARVASATPAGAPEAAFNVKTCGPVFRESAQHLVDREWFEICVQHSLWQFDDRSFVDAALVRHPMTGLTYLLRPDEGGSVALQQIAPECCRSNERADPDYVVGHAARFVAAHATRIMRLRRPWRVGAVYIRYTKSDPGSPYRNPVVEDAPPITVSPLRAIAETEPA